MQLPVYLDYNATTPCLQEVTEAMMPYFSDIFGNPASRQHLYGWRSEEGVEMAREEIATLIHARPKELIFTSGATEAINLIIKGITEPYFHKKGHIITATTEHKAVLDCCSFLQSKGLEVTYLPVNHQGIIDLNELESAIRSDTLLITLMMANNETGVIQPVEAIYEIAKRHRIPFFSDATQAIGKLPVKASDCADFICFSAHKMYGPKGIGCLYTNKKTNYPFTAQIHGGGHENQLRSGTLNTPAIVGFGKAAQLTNSNLNVESKRLQHLRDQLENALLRLENAQLNGDKTDRLPHVSNITFKHIDGIELLKRLNLKLAVSSGSACASVTSKPSHVLTSMGIDPIQAMASVRFSLGHATTQSEIEFAIETVTQTVTNLLN